MINKFARQIYSSIIILSAVLAGCSSGISVQSTLNNNSVQIDGEQKEWGKDLNYIDKENIGVGVKNDKDNIYISVITSDRTKIMKILGGGLTIWLENPENKNKVGIKYPDKMEFPNSDQMKEQGEPNGIGQKPEDNGANRIQNLINMQNEIVILDKDEIIIQNLKAEGEKGFKAKMGYSRGRFVYEVQIPASFSYSSASFSTDFKNNLKITLETGKMEMPQFNRTRMNNGERSGAGEGEGEGMSQGGGMRGGHSGRRGDGGSGSGQGNRSEMNNDPIKIELNVKPAL